MFTGLIADLGACSTRSSTTRRAPRCGSRTALAGELGEGDSIAVNGVCLTATAVDARGLRGAGDRRDAARAPRSASCARATPVNLELALRADERLGGHIVQGHVDGIGDGRASCARRASRAWSRSRSTPRCWPATWSRRARSRSTASSLTVSALREQRLLGLADPRDADAHDARPVAVGQRGQPRGRHPRQARRATDGGPHMSAPSEHAHDRSAARDPLRDDRGGDRGDPRRAHGRRLRRRGPRERGRPRDGRAVRDARGDQLHGQGGARLDLPRADPRALRRARAWS